MLAQPDPVQTSESERNKILIRDGIPFILLEQIVTALSFQS